MDGQRHQTEQDVRTRDATMVDAFLEVAPDGMVTVYSGKVELGTGIATALAQIVADELGVPFDRVADGHGRYRADTGPGHDGWIEDDPGCRSTAAPGGRGGAP